MSSFGRQRKYEYTNTKISVIALIFFHQFQSLSLDQHEIGQFYCQLSRTIKGNRNENVFDVDQSYTLLLIRGHANCMKIKCTHANEIGCPILGGTTSCTIDGHGNMGPKQISTAPIDITKFTGMVSSVDAETLDTTSKPTTATYITSLSEWLHLQMLKFLKQLENQPQQRQGP